MFNIQSHQEITYKSKSELKREMHDLQDLGISLTKLTLEKLKKLPLTDDLLVALIDAPKHHVRSAKRRHLQFIGKLMAKQNIVAIKEKLQEFNQANTNLNANFHLLEQMRNDLLTNGNTAINNLLAQYPNAERSYLRKLINASNKEQQLGNPPISARKLFKYLRELTA